MIAAAKREILEETGYRNVEFVEQVGWEQHSAFYAEHKEINRYSIEKCLVFHVLSEEQQEVSPEERSKHTFHWIKEHEVGNFLNLANELYFWDHYHK